MSVASNIQRKLSSPIATCPTKLSCGSCISCLDSPALCIGKDEYNENIWNNKNNQHCHLLPRSSAATRPLQHRSGIPFATAPPQRTSRYCAATASCSLLVWRRHSLPTATALTQRPSRWFHVCAVATTEPPRQTERANKSARQFIINAI